MSPKSLLKYLPHLAILASLLVYAYLLFIGNYDYVVKGSVILLPLILVSLFLIVKNKSLSCSDANFPYHKISCNTLGKIYFIIFFAAVIWMLLGNRGIVHLILIFALYCITLSQIFAKNPNAKLLILETILTTAILIIPKLFWPAYFYADTDLISHLYWASIITDTGYVTSAFGAYEFYCLYHILTAVTHAVTNLTANWSLYLISTVAVLASVPFVYLTAKYFTKSQRAALFSTFLYALLPMILHALSCPAPRVMATMAFFIIIYLLFALFRRYPIQTTILVCIAALYMSLVHHAQLLFILAVSAGLIFGAIIFYRKGLLKRAGAIILSLGFVCLLLLIGYGNSVISIIKNRFFKQVENVDLSESFKPVDSTKPTETITPNVTIPDTPTPPATDVPVIVDPVTPTIPSTDIIDAADEVINAGSSGLFDGFYWAFTTGLASAIMIILIFAGLYTLIMKLEHPKKISVILPLVLVTFAFFVPGVMDIFPIMTGAFQIYRFRYVMTFFFAIMMGVGCIILLNGFSRKNGSRKVGTVLTVVLCLGMVITCPILGYSKDNEVFYQYDFLPQAEELFDEGDLAAFSFAEGFITDTVYSDREHASYIERTKTVPGSGSKKALELFTEEGYSNSKMKTILYPQAKAERYDIRFWSGKSTTENTYASVGEYPPEIFEENIFRYNKIYLDYSDTYYVL